MATLLGDIFKADAWLVKNLKKEGHELDHSLESIKIIEEIINMSVENGEPKLGEYLEKHYGWKVFAMSAYIGETIIRTTNAARWITDDSSPEGELNIEIESANGVRMWPSQRVLKRIMEGDENNLHHYTAHVIKEMTFDGEPPIQYTRAPAKPRPWWKFW